MSVLFSATGTSLGGTERVVKALADGLGGLGLVVNAFGPTFDGPDVALRRDRMEWGNLLDRIRPRVVVTANDGWWPLGLEARRRHIPLLWMCTRLYVGAQGNLRRNYSATLANVTVVPSRFLLREFTDDPSPVEIIPNGIDVDTVNPISTMAHGRLAKETSSDPGSFLVGYFARFVPSKRHEDLLLATHLLRHEIPKLRLMLFSPPPSIRESAHLSHLQSLVQALGESHRVHFGTATPERVPELLSGLDAFVFPAVQEGFGCALLEAIVSEVPVAAADSGAVREIMRADQWDTFFPAGQPARVADAIYRIYSQPEHYRAIAHHESSLAARKFSHRTMLERYRDLLSCMAPLTMNRDGEGLGPHLYV